MVTRIQNAIPKRIALLDMFGRSHTLLLVCVAVVMIGAVRAWGDEFLVTSSKPVNMRVGPGRQYGIEWIYTKKFVPLRVIARTEGWIKVEDCEGATGWIMSALLKKKDYVSSRADKTVFTRGNNKNSPVIFTADACVIFKLTKCKKNMCRVFIDGLSGWTDKGNLWGA